MAEVRPHRVLLVLVDGIGLAAGNRDWNPFAVARTPALSALLGGRALSSDAVAAGKEAAGGNAALAAADATFGVDGLPQSGTGQTALLAGFPAPQQLGRHFGPWVPTTLRAPLLQRNFLQRALAAGRTAAFANAYPFQQLPHAGRRPAAAPLVAFGAGLPMRGTAELCSHTAVASSLTNERWQAHVGTGTVPRVSAARAGQTLAGIAADADVTLFAHYDTDHAGHRASMPAAVHAIEKLDAFLGGLCRHLPEDVLLVLTSDHGNLEDVRGGHTRNPVPVLAVGPGRVRVAETVATIADVVPLLLTLLGIGEGSTPQAEPVPPTGTAATSLAVG